MKPQALLIRTAGTNCDLELSRGLELAGAEVSSEHVDVLAADPKRVADTPIIAVPGGFSYGDDIAAGRIFANRLKHTLAEAMLKSVEQGGVIFGPCNGFQVLVKMGLLPDPADYTQSATLAHNTGGRFIDDWVGVAAPANTVCVWTQGMGDFDLPIAHGEGRFAASDDVLDAIQASGQVALTYTDNPNGSARDIAGVCDPTGRILGLMPHPERFYCWTQHPSRKGDGEPAGLRMLRQGVQAAGNTAVSANA